MADGEWSFDEPEYDGFIFSTDIAAYLALPTRGTTQSNTGPEALTKQTPRISTENVPLSVRRRVESRRSNLRTLLTAAIKRAPGVGWLRGGGCTIEIVDNMLGVPPEERERVPRSGGGDVDRTSEGGEESSGHSNPSSSSLHCSSSSSSSSGLHCSSSNTNSSSNSSSSAAAGDCLSADGALSLATFAGWTPRLPTGSAIPFLENILCCSGDDMDVLVSFPALRTWDGLVNLLRAKWLEVRRAPRLDLAAFGRPCELPPPGAREALTPADATPESIACAVLTGLLLVATYVQLRAGPKAQSWQKYPAPRQILLHDVKHIAMWTRYGRNVKATVLQPPPAPPAKRPSQKRPHTHADDVVNAPTGPLPAATAIHGVIEERGGAPPTSSLGMLEAMQKQGGVAYSRFDALFYLLKHEAAARSVKRQRQLQTQLVR
mmetsp:Transcript_7978/g.25498  ORF Transcript_7978/g.25498 Transcript_7978/m.25498 type:complete len:432 (-) Transcript_7978:47-1342(-)